jgi:hypothetical protein
MKSILLLSLPATVGIISWLLSWAFVFAFPPNSYHPYAHDMQMTFNRIFALMTYVGPAAAIFAVVAVSRSSCTRPKRIAFYLLNVVWGIFSLLLLVQFGFWLRTGHDRTVQSNQAMERTADRCALLF